MLRKVVLMGMSLGVMMQFFPAMSVYANVQQIYSYAQRGDLKALNSLRHQIDITDSCGNTALCYSVMNNDYKTFNLLRQVGASPKSQCVSNISPEQIKAFNQGYTRWYQSISKNVVHSRKNVSTQIATTGLSVGKRSESESGLLL